MSKPYYETEEYSEAENELDTYDDKVKLVMEYRVSEKHKDQQIAELKKQLEEKDQEIEKLVIAHFESEINKPVLTTTQMINQDKISFAVEQLTQAKEYINKSLEYMWNNNAEMTCRDRSIIDGIYNKIDNQIRELRGGPSATTPLPSCPQSSATYPQGDRRSEHGGADATRYA